MTASDHLGPQFYHGTTVASGLNVGDMITPGHEAQHDISSPHHVYFTDAQHRAKKWASEAEAAISRACGCSPWSQPGHMSKMPTMRATQGTR